MFGLRTVIAHRCLLDHMLACNLHFPYLQFQLFYVCLNLDVWYIDYNFQVKQMCVAYCSVHGTVLGPLVNF